MALILILLVGMLHYSNALCNFVEFDLKMNVLATYRSLGTFSVSTNRCQTIKTLIDYKIGSQNVKGSLMFSCTLNNNEIMVKQYSDEYCSDYYISNQQTLKMNSEYELIKNLVKIQIKNMECSDDSCMVSSAFGEDCTFSESKYYFNISVPPNQCETLSTSLPAVYAAIIENVEQEVLPPEFAVPLESDSSIKFACCKDHSLMIYNYSDTKCSPRHEVNAFRIPNSLNDVCLDISSYGNRRRTLFSEYIYNQRRLQQASRAQSMVLSWRCDELIECSIPVENDIPPQCSNTCTNWAWNPVSTAAPKTKSTTKDTTSVIISIAVLVVFIIIIVIVYGVLRYKTISKQVVSQAKVSKKQRNKKHLQENIQIQTDSKYKPMIEESMDNNNQATVIVPQSISSFDNSNIQNDNIPVSFENQNYITVASINDDA